ncbi:MAG: fumarylacetoacetate hydrolase family protein [Candidatus Bathyarchaeota archaeon]|nr:fumarylacetoacetate hydrolase family protein [Candidatus Bathyarchaeota archaeon]
MRFARYVHGGKESYGVLNEDGGIIDLPKLSRLKDCSVPPSIEEFISSRLEAESLLEELADGLPDTKMKKVTTEKTDLVLKAPLVAPPKIICLGLNYRDHAEEAGEPIPDEPVIFMEPRTAIIGSREAIIKPRFVKQLDYEVELAIIIGRKGKDIPVSEAEDHIFGYTVLNDISARDIQFKDGQWTRGKSFDTFAPLGPCITTAAQIGDPNSLHVCSRVNGETRQDSSTRHMIFNVYDIVHRLSRVMTLEPCDVIATGTPAGVAVFMKPEQKFLQPGDTVEVEIEKIGTLRNPVLGV